jgi:hypothetical protein
MNLFGFNRKALQALSAAVIMTLPTSTGVAPDARRQSVAELVFRISALTLFQAR